MRWTGVGETWRIKPAGSQGRGHGQPWGGGRASVCRLPCCRRRCGRETKFQEQYLNHSSVSPRRRRRHAITPNELRRLRTYYYLVAVTAVREHAARAARAPRVWSSLAAGAAVVPDEIMQSGGDALGRRPSAGERERHRRIGGTFLSVRTTTEQRTGRADPRRRCDSWLDSLGCEWYTQPCGPAR